MAKLHIILRTAWARRHSRKTLATLLIVALSLHWASTPTADAQTETCWAMRFGFEGFEVATSIQQTPDGGYVLAGHSRNTTGSSEAFLVKLSQNGSVAWDRVYGDLGYEQILHVQQTIDAGYLAAGESSKYQYGTLRNPVGDAWVLKLGSDGAIEWQKTYSSYHNGRARYAQQTADGGYVVVVEDIVETSTRDYFLILLKLRPDGSIMWQRAYACDEPKGPFPSSDLASSFLLCSDGGLLVSGITKTLDKTHVWLLKLDSDGSTSWRTEYKGYTYMEISSIEQALDGGYVAVGKAGDATEGLDLWALKVNQDGAVEWQETLGGPGDDYATSLQRTVDGGYIVAGATASFGVGVLDAWVVKLGADGVIYWQKAYGGALIDSVEQIRCTTDGGYVFAGRSDVSVSESDAWVVKVGVNGDIEWGQGSGVSSTSTNATAEVASATYSPAASYSMDTAILVSDSHAVQQNRTYSSVILALPVTKQAPLPLAKPNDVQPSKPSPSSTQTDEWVLPPDVLAMLGFGMIALVVVTMIKYKK